MISKEEYKYKSWKDKFKNKKIIIKIDNVLSWDKFLKEILDDTEKDFSEIEDKLNDSLIKKKNIYPYPDLLFYAFRCSPYKDLKVVILGQDPYFNYEHVPQATGLSFSVPDGVKIPSSLNNIYKNMIKYKVIKKFPKTGNLEHWANQGCLMLNASLTVEEKNPNVHYKLWKWFTDGIIKKISDEKKNIIFVLWGAFATKKKYLIDDKKHHILISSHPSGLSCNRPMKQYPAFMNYNHFGEINKLLKKNNKKEIIFDL